MRSPVQSSSAFASSSSGVGSGFNGFNGFFFPSPFNFASSFANFNPLLSNSLDTSAFFQSAPNRQPVGDVRVRPQLNPSVPNFGNVIATRPFAGSSNIASTSAVVQGGPNGQESTVLRLRPQSNASVQTFRNPFATQPFVGAFQSVSSNSGQPVSAFASSGSTRGQPVSAFANSASASG